MKRILIAGIGNIFLGDDAFGVAAAQALAARAWPPGVEVRDFGIRCLDLAYAVMNDWDEVILLDAAPRGDVPGTLYRIALDPAAAAADSRVEGHSVSVGQIGDLARRLRALAPGDLPRFTLIGCEPASFEPTDGELSPAVAAAVPASVAMVGELVHELSLSHPLEESLA